MSKKKKINTGEMPFLAHVGVLRKHILRCLVAVCAGAALVGYKMHFVMDHIIFGPVQNDFITFRIMNTVSGLFGSKEVFSMPAHFPILVRRIFEQLNTAFYVAVVGGFILVFPYVIYEMWKFIAPGLKPNERKNSLTFFLSTYFLFLFGCCFGYFLITPLTMHFGYFFNISDTINIQIDLSNYISILLQTVLGMGLVFLLPVIVYALTAVGILTPKFLKTYRRHAVIVILILAGFITPGDIPSMLVASIPLYMLYEASILVSAVVYKRNLSDNKEVLKS
ncbi:twin-arginine translocase subunit TatC [Apibacter raozihei]|uniref:twin-arginine translocase subunit TatC n=1 Tax=Apibacter TaxID=1778601 RepID=UPI000FE29F77|nr:MULTISPECIES: twin-arginine translocase subunit TatC [Apibacter]